MAHVNIAAANCHSLGAKQIMRFSGWATCMLSCLVVMIAPVAGAAEQVINGEGQLIGATNVIVDGQLYDVTFVDGTCIQVFDQCDDPSDFLFNDVAAATAASTALEAQVLVDTVLGNFDAEPELVMGCDVSVGCIAWTPVSVVADQVNLNGILNLPLEVGNNELVSDTQSVAFNLQLVPSMTFAVWSLANDKLDTDSDGVFDAEDNCIDQANPSQLDSNADGFGNICDQDTNNDCIINFIDISLFANVFLSNDADHDFDGNGAVNFIDFGLLASAFTGQPGPSALASCDAF